MWLGTGVALVVCLVVGVIVHLGTDGLRGKGEQAVEGGLALSAALVLTYMILWMRKNSRSLGGHLRAKIDLADTGYALGIVAFVAVAREGLETVLFLLGAETGSASGAQVVIGGVLGLLISAAIGLLIYVGGSRIDLGKVGKTLDHTNWVRMQSRFAIVEMLNQVIGCITDERLRVDHQPGLPLGLQNISSVKVGGEQSVCRLWLRERLEQPQSFAYQPGIGPVLSLSQRFIAPTFQHVRQVPESVQPVRRSGSSPKALQ